MGAGARRGDESGFSLVEMTIAMALLAVVVVAVDSSLTVIEERQVQVTNATEALDTLQTAQQFIDTDIRAATAWTTPAVPTSPPSQPVTVSWPSSGGSCGTTYGLDFTASLNNATATIAICLNTTTHVLTVTCSGSAVACPGNNSGTVTEVQLANIDSSSAFTFTTKEVSTTVSSVTTNTFFFTTVASSLTLDSPGVGAPRLTKTIVTSPSLEVFNVAYACRLALSQAGASGSC
jgi:prepilin-type N-terminal cleavage/methylation domain-containing protein